MQFQGRDELFFAGQLTGVEGYVGSVATGMLAGINAVQKIRQEPMWVLPKDTMIGALTHYVCQADSETFQPMKANFGLMRPLEQKVRGKRERHHQYCVRASAALEQHLERFDDE